jgi:hypothetical protein
VPERGDEDDEHCSEQWFRDPGDLGGQEKRWRRNEGGHEYHDGDARAA